MFICVLVYITPSIFLYIILRYGYTMICFHLPVCRNLGCLVMLFCKNIDSIVQVRVLLSNVPADIWFHLLSLCLL